MSNTVEIKTGYNEHKNDYYISFGNNRGYLLRNGEKSSCAIRGEYLLPEIFTKQDSSWHKTLQEAVDTCDRLGYSHNHPKLSKLKQPKTKTKPKTEHKTYYKVVSQIDEGILQSARHGNVRYELDQWVQAGDKTKLFVFDRVQAGDKTKLFVFDNLQAARNFMYDGDKLFECKVKGLVPLSPARYFSDIKRYWEAFASLRAKHRKVNDKALQAEFRKLNNYNLELATQYKNCLVVSAVKLTKEIK